MKKAALALALLATSGAHAQNSLNTGSAPVQTATPANSSHAAGVSVGGLFTFPEARVPGGSGLATQFTWISTGGAVVTYQVKLWDVSPTHTTCTDNTAFAGSTVDDQHLITPPFTVTAAAPTNTTGDTKTYASFSWSPPLSWRNQDATRTNNVYGCVITTQTDTADDNAPVYANLFSVQD